jgi:hypothetical protein
MFVSIYPYNTIDIHIDIFLIFEASVLYNKYHIVYLLFFW